MSISHLQAARILGINKDTVKSARLVLNEETDEEIKAIERGVAAVNTIAHQIKARIPEEKRVLKSTAHHDGRRANAKLWQELRGALLSFARCSLLGV